MGRLSRRPLVDGDAPSDCAVCPERERRSNPPSSTAAAGFVPSILVQKRIQLYRCIRMPQRRLSLRIVCCQDDKTSLWVERGLLTPAGGHLCREGARRSRLQAHSDVSRECSRDWGCQVLQGASAASAGAEKKERSPSRQIVSVCICLILAAVTSQACPLLRLLVRVLAAQQRL